MIDRVDGENGSYMKSINGAYKKQRKKKRMYRDGLTFVEGRNENAPVYRLQSFFDNILYKRQMERHLQSREMVVLFLVSYNKFRKNKIFTKFLFSKNKLPSPFRIENRIKSKLKIIKSSNPKLQISELSIIEESGVEVVSPHYKPYNPNESKQKQFDKFILDCEKYQSYEEGEEGSKEDSIIEDSKKSLSDDNANAS